MRWLWAYDQTPDEYQAQGRPFESGNPQIMRGSAVKRGKQLIICEWNLSFSRVTLYDSIVQYSFITAMKQKKKKESLHSLRWV